MIEFFRDLFRDPQEQKEVEQRVILEIIKVQKWLKPFNSVLYKNVNRFLDECEKDRLDPKCCAVGMMMEAMFFMHSIREKVKLTGANMEKVDLVLIDIIRRGKDSDFWKDAQDHAKTYAKETH